MRREFTRLLEGEPYSPDLTRKIAKNRLVKAVLEGTPSNVSREIELLGKFREHDWRVRNSEAKLGILLAPDQSHWTTTWTNDPRQRPGHGSKRLQAVSPLLIEHSDAPLKLLNGVIP